MRLTDDERRHKWQDPADACPPERPIDRPCEARGLPACPRCGQPARWENAHLRCDRCGIAEACCEGAG